ncbi:MAG: DUF2335 domain-containing protein [Acidobacteriaceae bacterium]|nr:DUF2335 domain-containing protein [Acidobacteriaceae bacterium]
MATPSNKEVQTPASSQPGTIPDLLPKAELLRHYDEIAPGTAAIMIQEVVAQLQHKRQLEANRQNYDYDLQKREQRLQGWAQIFAFAVAITAIGGGLWLAYTTASTARIVTGAVITGGTVLSIVVAFLKSRKATPLPSRTQKTDLT